MNITKSQLLNTTGPYFVVIVLNTMSEFVCDVEQLIAQDLLHFEEQQLRSKHEENLNYDDDETVFLDSMQQISRPENDAELLEIAITENAHSHFNQMKALCSCIPKCVTDASIKRMESMALPNEEDRTNTVRATMLSVSAPPGMRNDLMTWDTNYAQNRKGKLKN